MSLQRKGNRKNEVNPKVFCPNFGAHFIVVSHYYSINVRTTFKTASCASSPSAIICCLLNIG